MFLSPMDQVRTLAKAMIWEARRKSHSDNSLHNGECRTVTLCILEVSDEGLMRSFRPVVSSSETFATTRENMASYLNKLLVNYFADNESNQFEFWLLLILGKYKIQSEWYVVWLELMRALLA